MKDKFKKKRKKESKSLKNWLENVKIGMEKGKRGCLRKVFNVLWKINVEVEIIIEKIEEIEGEEWIKGMREEGEKKNEIEWIKLKKVMVEKIEGIELKKIK